MKGFGVLGGGSRYADEKARTLTARTPSGAGCKWLQSRRSRSADCCNSRLQGAGSEPSGSLGRLRKPSRSIRIVRGQSLAGNMASVRNGIGGWSGGGGGEEENFEDAFEHIPVAAKMDIKCALEECSMAINLFLNNKFSESLELLRPWSKDSMYHALGFSTILVFQATMTFEQQDIQMGLSTLKEALQTCQKFRKRNTVVESLSNLVSKQPVDQLSEDEMHAELCYAECLLQKAVLTFIQDENMISFIKGGLKIRTSYQIYKECLQVLQMAQSSKIRNEIFHQFEGGVQLGIGAFNLMLSLLPGRILRLLEFIGFSGNRELGLHQLREGASGPTLRAVVSTFILLLYHCFVSLILGTGETNLVEAETLLQPFLQKFPKGALVLFYDARINILKGNFEKAEVTFQDSIAAQQEWKQLQHLCYWELMWSYSFQQNWLQAYRYADLLCKESRWSKAIYVFQKAAILCMLPDADVKTTGEDIVALFRQVEGLKQRIAGKSLPTEKFAVRKSRRYGTSPPVKLIVPALEMMYVWSGFSILGKRTDFTENMLVTIEKEETLLKNETHHNEYYMDDVCLLQLLKGMCLKHLGRLLQAELCFSQVIQSEKQLKYDTYLAPYSMYELGLLYKQQDERGKAIRCIEAAKNNYKDYSMESRLHFRIHAALNSMKVTPAPTP
ncbi:tetratricopeptide repeat protein 39B isoform X1 [Crotalus tigris]|uniref:tetratricopeptide repeat protein 39B isoform X1 n=1 Tax=Crotalus tigris TaxID=88082 RepID=UPI00192F9744|nr:tetratricopeptide repeat protein 39B isoform X1 [Crotalus tigris]